MPATTTSEGLTPAQHFAAKVVGFFYLFTKATAIVTFVIRGKLMVPGAAARNGGNIAASGQLFRVSSIR